MTATQLGTPAPRWLRPIGIRTAACPPCQCFGGLCFKGVNVSTSPTHRTHDSHRTLYVTAPDRRAYVHRAPPARFGHLDPPPNAQYTFGRRYALRSAMKIDPRGCHVIAIRSLTRLGAHTLDSALARARLGATRRCPETSLRRRGALLLLRQVGHWLACPCPRHRHTTRALTSACAPANPLSPWTRQGGSETTRHAIQPGTPSNVKLVATPRYAVRADAPARRQPVVSNGGTVGRSASC